ncbi:MAG: glycosyltransferase family 39 protein, partial [Planctomycetota bacterium]
MQDHHRHQLGILVVAAGIMLIGLGSTRLWDEDEAFFAGAAAEMHAQGDWVVPSFNGRLFAHKPP